MGDTEFIAAFYHLLIPIARQFKPDMVNNLISKLSHMKCNPLYFELGICICGI